MSCLLLLIFGLCGLAILVQGQCSSPLDNDSNDSLSSVVQRFNSKGLVMLLPDIKFNCTGYISLIEGWMYLDEISSTHYLQYEIWRPTSSNNYNLVSSVIINDGTDHRTVTDNIRAYTHNASSGNGQLQFQKDDIFGIYLPDPISGNIFFPTYLTNASQGNGGPGVRVYSATSVFEPCSVALCSNYFSIMENVTFQIRIEQEALSTPLNQQTPGCRDTPEFLICDAGTSSINMISTSLALMSTSPTPTPSATPEGGTSHKGLPLSILVGVPVGGTVLLVVLIVLLVIACLGLKYGKNMLKRKTEKVYHYNADNGSEYAFPMKPRDNRANEDETDKTEKIGTEETEGVEEKGKGRHLDAVIINDEEHETSDLLTPLPSNFKYFTIGSPSPSTIQPYAALVDASPVEATRGRSATVSGPIGHHMNRKSKLETLVSMPALDAPGASDAFPYLEATSSLNNISRNPPPLPPPRSEDVRKISQPSRFPRISSATTRKATSQQQLNTPRVSSAKVRKSSQPVKPQKLMQLKGEAKRKISHPAKFPGSNGLPPSPKMQHKESSMSLTLGPLPLTPNERLLQIERDKSFSTLALSSQSQATRTSPRAAQGGRTSFGKTGGEPSPYMEPSPTTKLKRFTQKNLEKSLSHDVLTVTGESSPTFDKKNQVDGEPSPYLEPSATSPNKPRKKFATIDTKDRKLSAPLDRRGLNLTPPEVASKNREANTGQLLSGQPVPSEAFPPVPPPISIGPGPSRKTLISTTSTLVELISPTETISDGSPSKDQLFHTDEPLCVPDASARQLWEDSSEFEIYSKLERFEGAGCMSAANKEFNTPPSSTLELYNTLSNQKYREIIRGQIGITGECLGSGHFANVYKGTWNIKGGKLFVAVKTLKPNAPYEEEVKFLQEACITGQFMHPNIVQLHGVVTLGKPLMIVLELMNNGDLKSYLKFQKKNIIDENINQEKLIRQFVMFARNVASGMDYLSQKSFVHRDLAARNIFLTNNFTCKIGDFGMARDLAKDDCYEARGTTIPLKWTAPEAVDYRRYTSASDVWSYGMLLYEMWSVGHKPFYNYKNHEVLELIRNGFCQPPPPGCTRGIYRLMVRCWNPVGPDRPSFSDIVEYLAQPDEAFLPNEEEDVGRLGNDMDEWRHLHSDLQNSYTTSSSSMI